MKVLAIYPGHNATVAYFEDGVCKIILQEEKLNNIKNYFGFPSLSLDFLATKITKEEIDYFVFGSTTQFMMTTIDGNSLIENASSSSMRKLYNYLEYKTGWKFLFTGLRNIILSKVVTPRAWVEIESSLRKKGYKPEGKVLKVDHHLSHALTPVYFFGLDELHEDRLLFSMDGAGDNYFAKVFIYLQKEKKVEQIAASSLDSSLGLLFSEMTRFLGMIPNEHEYKVMGLAAYVSRQDDYIKIYNKLKSLVWLDEKTLGFKSKFNMNVASLYFKKHLCFERFDSMAAAVQKLTEDLVMSWIKAAILKTGIANITLSGGVFMNVKMNQKILEMPEVKTAYFQPSCGDESSGIGAAYKFFLDNKIKIKPIKTMFLGLAYSNSQVKEYLKINGYFQKYDIEYVDNIEEKIADLIANFHIVARVKGSGEWGARSLCNRSIIGNASDMKTFYQVNDMIKMRDFWMPFAPTILSEWGSKYVKNWELVKEKAYDSTKYMILTFNSTELAQEHLKAAMHQKDKTLRPQIVDEYDNQDLYKLLKYYEKLTGMGGFMNTSLNIHGYPSAGTLEQAMFTFDNSGLRIIALENYLIRKKSTNK